ncbi:MAG: hypothetical protein NPIRA05_23020 [Nitrospirales bacterium]|nr:MAG: hypothetical protein NPIRA05_23020 [Nitrospirales bacterium]
MTEDNDSFIRLAKTATNSCNAGKLNPHLAHQIPKTFNVNTRINIVGMKDVGDLLSLRPPKKCSPRKRAIPARDSLGMSTAIIEKLGKADKKVLTWLAESDGNRELFLTDPIAALKAVNAGFDRKELKELSRFRMNVSKAEVLPPGWKLNTVSTRVTGASANRPQSEKETSIHDCPPDKPKKRGEK